eukprot:CAMPEP_0174894812 /NCGR_PEP_ID=MMETSP0167-20121228/9357_1 /TAXON_ID=38298 /ORGANISM="Rhodella maculata, Strain CCMP736" /LENGTH=283 /DNA_ID=CAMNT_0016133995 /DNA_START=150 /DNA_END=1001 /DNA_ORIENTATION=-
MVRLIYSGTVEKRGEFLHEKHVPILELNTSHSRSHRIPRRVDLHGLLGLLLLLLDRPLHLRLRVGPVVNLALRLRRAHVQAVSAQPLRAGRHRALQRPAVLIKALLADHLAARPEAEVPAGQLLHVRRAPGADVAEFGRRHQRLLVVRGSSLDVRGGFRGVMGGGGLGRAVDRLMEGDGGRGGRGLEGDGARGGEVVGDSDDVLDVHLVAVMLGEQVVQERVELLGGLILAVLVLRGVIVVVLGGGGAAVLAGHRGVPLELLSRLGGVGVIGGKVEVLIGSGV